jgi:hypothetical protein
MNVKELSAHFGAMLAPSTKAISRKAWGLDVETFWVPVFTAAKVMGYAQDLPDESLGAPIRLAYDKDGSVKFSQTTGLPTFKVDPRVTEKVKLAMENYSSANLQHVGVVAQERKTAYQAQVKRQQDAGRPFIEADDAAQVEAVRLMHEAAAAALAEAAQIEVDTNHKEPATV